MFRAVLAAMIAASPSLALAYGLKTTSTGETLRWPDGEIAIEVALEGGPSEVTDASAVAATDAAAASWRDALVGSGSSLAITASSGAVISGDGVTSLRWALDEEDPGIDVGLLATTHVAYQVADGEIQEADVVVNAAEFGWTTTTGGCLDSYDLQSTLTHEFGHLLGLAHSDDPAATMFTTGTQCEILKRDLLDDDVAGVDHLYFDLPPPGGIPPSPVVSCTAGGGAGRLSALFVAIAVLGLARRRVACVALLLACSAAPARAAELRLLELAELGARADLVVRGQVIATATAPDELATDADVSVTECLAGECPAGLQIRRRGGEQGGRGLLVDGEAELRPGQEVVLYLRARPDRPYAVIGGVQGALRVVRHDGRLHAARDLRGHRVLSAAGWRRGGIELASLAEVRRSAAR